MFRSHFRTSAPSACDNANTLVGFTQSHTSTPTCHAMASIDPAVFAHYGGTYYGALNLKSLNPAVLAKAALRGGVIDTHDLTREQQALAATQGNAMLKLCTLNVACKEDDMLCKQWNAYCAHLVSTWDRIIDMGTNVICLQEVAEKVWTYLKKITQWIGHWHPTQKFAILWNPQVTSTNS